MEQQLNHWHYVEISSARPSLVMNVKTFEVLQEFAQFLLQSVSTTLCIIWLVWGQNMQIDWNEQSVSHWVRSFGIRATWPPLSGWPSVKTATIARVVSLLAICCPDIGPFMLPRKPARRIVYNRKHLLLARSDDIAPCVAMALVPASAALVLVGLKGQIFDNMRPIFLPRRRGKQYTGSR